MTRPYYSDDYVTLYHGDCRDVLPAETWKRDGLLLIDPPYGIAYESGQRRRAGNARSIAGDEDAAVRDTALALWGGGRALVFGSWKVAKPAGTRAVLYWDTKGALGMGDLSLPWRNSTQEIYVLGRGFNGRRQGNVLRFAPVQSMGRYHPHQKPIDLLQQLIRHAPDPVVVDAFAGSGSTLIAAKNIGRRAIGCEVSEAHCESAARRLSQGTLDLGGVA